MKPKAALVKDGFLPPGSENTRGRMSGAAIERCKELSAQGWEIDGFETTKSTGSAPATVKRTAVTNEKVIAEIPENPLRDESVWTAYANDGDKVVPVGMRTVCNVCHSSLTYCPCRSPRVWLDYDREVVVNFKPLS